MSADSDWLEVVYGEAARKLAEREAPPPSPQRQSDKKAAYDGDKAASDAGAARPL